MANGAGSPWDLTALFNAADPKAGLAERHLWVIRLLEWLRRAPLERSAAGVFSAEPPLADSLANGGHPLSFLLAPPDTESR